MKDIESILIENLAYYRNKNKLSQVTVANELGVTRQAVYAYESPNGNSPTYKKLEALAKLYNCSPADLITERKYDNSVTGLGVKVPVIKDCSCEDIMSKENIVETKFIPVQDIQGVGEYFCVISNFAGMQPYIELGDLLLVRHTESVSNASYIIAEVDGVVGAFYYKLSSGDIVLESKNPFFPSITISQYEKHKIKIKGQIEKVIRTL